MYDGVVQGIADIGLSNLGYTFGRFKETELLDLPLGFPNAWVANKVAADFYEEYQPAEFDETVVLTLHTSPVNNIITIDRAVERLEDMQGLELRGTGYIAQFVEALGATARPIAMPEAYDNLSRNVIQGLMIPYETVVTFNFGEVTHHITEVWPLGQVYTFYLVMNRDTWNSLPSEIQNIITDYVENEFRDKLTNMWNEVDITGYEYAVDAGYEFHRLSDQELARWQAVADQVIEEYIAGMVAEGHSEDELRARIDFVRGRIAYWTEQQRAEGVKSSTGPDDLRVSP
ncbi:MAG TPA: TRAP transporter substrate-binding protein, partial [Bacillota bacterium]